LPPFLVLIVAIVFIGLIFLTKQLTNQSSSFENKNQTGYEIFNNSDIGGVGNSVEISSEILQQIETLFGDKLLVSDLPVSYGLPIFPDSYREELLERMGKTSGYKSKEIKGNIANWIVYDVNNTDFKEFYLQSSVSPYYKNGIRLFAVNKIDRKFIAISQKVLPEEEDLYLKEIINIFEKSEFYRDYPLMQVDTLELHKNFGYYTQFTFHSLYNTFRSKVIVGRAFNVSGGWLVNYEGTQTYYDFIERQYTESGSEGEAAKKNILNMIKKNEKN